MTMDKIRQYPGMDEVMPLFIGGSDDLKPEMTLQSIVNEHPTWNAADMQKGLRRLEAIAGSGSPFIYDVYSEEEIRKEPGKQAVKLVYFPATERKECVILAAGGAYGAVCSLSEAFPVAAVLNELGVPVFCLNYRVGPPRLMPKPMEDMAAAVRFLTDHAEQFSLDMDHYAVGGFSAGGHLAASWGTAHLGARSHGLTQPEVLLLDYPMISMWKTISMMPDYMAQVILRGYFGEEYAEKDCRPYNLECHIDEQYPPVYLVQAKDDDTVMPWNGELLRRALERYGVKYKVEDPAFGGHGFGLGTATDAAGWVERAVEFWNGLRT